MRSRPETFRAGSGHPDLVTHFSTDLFSLGNVEIQRGARKIIIPVQHLLDFLAYKVRKEKIHRLEIQSSEEILGLDAGEPYE